MPDTPSTLPFETTSSTRPARRVKVFGERNTSTNAVAQLIAQNAAVEIFPGTADALRPGIQCQLDRMTRLGVPVRLREHLIDRVFRGQPPTRAWKHALTDFEAPAVDAFSRCHVVICVRHPGSWVLGLHRRPYHLHGRAAADLNGFLDLRWRTVAREGLGRRALGAIDIYNRKMRGYLGFLDRLKGAGIGTTIVRLEDFTTGQEAVFDRFRPHLAGVANVFRPLTRSTKEGGKTAEDYADYYGNRRWEAEIDAKTRRRIEGGIDWDACARFGYPDWT